MNKNSRQTYINAINRNYHFVHSTAFKEQDADLLNEKWELLKATYVRFLEEHNALVNKEQTGKLKAHQDLATQMEDIYVETVTAFRKRINELEAIELVKRTEKAKREAKEKQPEKEKRAEKVENTPDTDTSQLRHHPTPNERNESSRFYVNENRPTNPYEPQHMSQASNQRAANDLRNQIEQQAKERALQERARQIVIQRRTAERERERDRHIRSVVVPKHFACHLCEGPHALNKCDVFLDMNIEKRRETVQELGLCTNCFAKTTNPRHTCNRRHGACQRCREFHNSLLWCAQLEPDDQQ